MRVFITGATGFVGSALARDSSHRPNADLVLLARSETKIPTGLRHLSWHIGDIVSLRPEDLRGVDVVIHCAAKAHDAKAPDDIYETNNVQATRHLVECAAQAGVKRFIFISTVKVNGEFNHDEKPFSAADAPRPTDAYARSKWQGEQIVREIAGRSGMEWVIVRPPVMYGLGMKGNLHLLCRLIERGIPLPFGLIRNKRSLLSVSNLADALWHMAAHPQASGQVFFISDGAPVSTPELTRSLASVIGRPARLLPVPSILLKTICALTGRHDIYTRLCSSLHVDDTPLREKLQWTPPLPLTAAMQRLREE